jgi:hypothetical protein
MWADRGNSRIRRRRRRISMPCCVMNNSRLCHVCVYKSNTCVLNYHSILARAKPVLNCNFEVGTSERRYNSPAC